MHFASFPVFCLFSAKEILFIFWKEQGKAKANRDPKRNVGKKPTKKRDTTNTATPTKNQPLSPSNGKTGNGNGSVSFSSFYVIGLDLGFPAKNEEMGYRNRVSVLVLFLDFGWFGEWEENENLFVQKKKKTSVFILSLSLINSRSKHTISVRSFLRKQFMHFFHSFVSVLMKLNVLNRSTRQFYPPWGRQLW